jgi:hypothetical protein
MRGRARIAGDRHSSSPTAILALNLQVGLRAFERLCFQGRFIAFPRSRVKRVGRSGSVDETCLDYRCGGSAGIAESTSAHRLPMIACTCVTAIT